MSPNPRTLWQLLDEVAKERYSQNEKWGEQHHPDGTSEAYKKLADEAKEANDRAVADGVLSWADILTEEFLEAMAEIDPAKLRAELVQISAVCVAWVEDIDSRTTGKPTVPWPEVKAKMQAIRTKGELDD
jgi:hypothetical protein